MLSGTWNPSPATPAPADRFLGVLNLVHPEEPSWIRRFYNAVQDHPHVHKAMYDEGGLRRRLKAHGFDAIHAATYGKSRYIPEIADVEFRTEGYEGSVYLEARAPAAGIDHQNTWHTFTSDAHEAWHREVSLK